MPKMEVRASGSEGGQVIEKAAIQVVCPPPSPRKFLNLQWSYSQRKQVSGPWLTEFRATQIILNHHVAFKPAYHTANCGPED